MLFQIPASGNVTVPVSYLDPDLTCMHAGTAVGAYFITDKLNVHLQMKLVRKENNQSSAETTYPVYALNLS